ncbi:MAG: proteasome assembly chaperone family protein, partial [Candidatus Micrarchaeota archaeon]
LPGLGLVGMLAAEHLVSELKAKKFAELYSPDFPPQVTIKQDSTIAARKNEFYYWKAEEKGQKDIIILVGDDQGLTVQSQYHLCGLALDLAEHYKTKMIYTLGGYGMQRMSKAPRVFGAVTHKTMIRDFKKQGVIFQKTGGAIIGAAGLLLGLGKLRGMKGICLMGETHGNYIDPRSAKSVLSVVCGSLRMKISYDKLEENARKTEELISKAESEKRSQQQPLMDGAVPGLGETPLDKDHLSYIR